MRGLGRTTEQQQSLTISATSNSLAGLKALTKNRGAGRPGGSREKAPYENISRRTRLCSICHAAGHKRTIAQRGGDEPKPKAIEVHKMRC